MAHAERFHRWCLKEEDLKDLNAVKARDLIINCFYETQKETFARSKQSLGLHAGEDQLQSSVLSAIRLAFKEAGEVLGRKSKAWGTPQDIIEYHRDQIARVISELK